MSSGSTNSASFKRTFTREQAGLVRKHLRVLLSSPAFARSKRTQEFLSLVVRHTLSGEFSSLRERMIGAELFGRSVDYDTGSDSVVRVMATEVRRRLAQFYLESEPGWSVKIDLPIGSYEPHFHFVEEPLPESSSVVEEPPQLTKLLQTSKPTLITSSTQFLAEVSTSAVAAPGEVGEFTPRTAGQTKGIAGRSKRTLILVGAVVLVLLCVTFAFYKKNRSNAVNGRQPIYSVVILPLKNLSGDRAQDFFADGMTEELINDLGQVSTLRVISLTSSMSLKNSTKLAPEIAKELGVQGIVEGSAQRENGQVRIRVQLIDARADQPVWAQTYVRDTDSILSLQGEIAVDIAYQINASVSPQDQGRLVRNRHIKPAAQDLYLRGVLMLNAEDDTDALSFLQKAVAADPDSAQTHTALAECAGRMGTSGLLPSSEAFATQKSEAIRAISLDPLLAESHADLADAELGLNWDWQGAAQEYQRALELNPNSAAIREKYAIYLLYTGQVRDAVTQVETGAGLDPISAITLRNQAFVYFFARDYDKALALINSTRSMGVLPPGWEFFLGAVHSATGEYTQSINAFLHAPRTTHTDGHLAYSYAKAGDTGKAQMLLTQFRQHLSRDKIGQYEIALAYAGLGDKRHAIEWLKQAYAARDIGLLYLKVDPCLDSLRGEPEFQKLERNVGLTP